MKYDVYLFRVVSFQFVTFMFVVLCSKFSLGVTQDTLEVFLGSLEVSEASLKVQISEEVDGSANSRKRWLRFRRESGVEVKKIDATWRRWIWNSDYIALLESSNGQDWVLLKVEPVGESELKDRSSEKRFAKTFLGGALVDRINIASISKTIESAQDIVCYEYHPGSPLYSENLEFNEFCFRFDCSGDSPKLLEFYCQDALGDSQKVENTIRFNYPNSSPWPLRRVMTSVIRGGEDDGKVLTREEVIDFDDENAFDAEECRLSYYGLPEPDFLRKRGYWTWWLGAAVLGAVAVVTMYFRSQANA